ncbi:MAG TPA: peptidoglycan editing factor PgeF [Deltaproteobacteria bacterium]|nr:hypothetical protein [Deltaproteobacteria bacterium]HCP44982.1 peptidoglycan editing factor PgeF [Deltaproteobacteria bacterium]
MITPGFEAPSWADERLAYCGFTLRGTQPPEAIECKTQVHGAEVHCVGPGDSPLEGDGLWTTASETLIAVRIADCVPVLLWDPEVPAVAAVHAGWRGTAQNIVGAALQTGRRIGIQPARVRAALGPSIGLCCFEVGEEVIEGLMSVGLSPSDVSVSRSPGSRPHLDLRQANRVLLRRAGLSDHWIEDVGGCTYCSPDRYDSYRRDGARSSRMRGVIGLARSLALLLFLWTTAACTEGPIADPIEEPGLLASEAEALLQQDQPQEAEDLLREALEMTPDDAHSRASLALSLHRQGRFREALVQGRLALGIDPTFWQAAYNLACSAAALGERDQAVGWLQAALASGVPTLEEVASDPDLAALEDDHRFAFYKATGILSRQEEDAVAFIHPGSVAVGEATTVTVVAIALNRPLMAPRAPVTIEPAWTIEPGLLRPLARKETFSAGAEGGREYMQRNFQYQFRALRPGRLQVGPFRVSLEGVVRWTQPIMLEVQESSMPMAQSDEAPPVPASAFFAAPSLQDSHLIEKHAAQDGEVALVDPLSNQPTGLAWTEDNGMQRRMFRFRATQARELPSSLPSRPPQAFRSVLLQRATEGWSHVIDQRRSAADDLD